MPSCLEGKHIIVGITGGIAAYKACELVSRLRKTGADVHVIMTKHACEFVQPLTLETLSCNHVYTDLFDRSEPGSAYVQLAGEADCIVVAPATANFIGKIANGIPDDLLTRVVLATKASILIAPAMNTGMWESTSNRDNCRQLKEAGIRFVGPAGGFLACGDNGTGRMSEPVQIFEAVEGLFDPAQDMTGLKVLVTAGAAVEALDPVRYITNRSSGKMGIAIAAAARDRGAEVTLVCGKVTVELPKNVNVVTFQGTASLLHVMEAEAPQNDIVIQAAAPADFAPVTVAEQKIKKNGRDELTLHLISTPDVAAAIGKNKREGQTFVGFAAETENVLENAEGKLKKKNLDMVVANDVSREGAGFGVDTNIVTLITHAGSSALPIMTKKETAIKILDKVLELRRN